MFDENGKFVDQWPVDKYSSINFLYISADRKLWAADDRNSRIVEYDLDGHLLYSWGTLADWPGGLFNTHGMTVDQEGNFYVAEVGNGRAQKFRPRPGSESGAACGQAAVFGVEIKGIVILSEARESLFRSTCKQKTKERFLRFAS